LIENIIYHESPIHGIGVFAKVDIPAGSHVSENEFTSSGFNSAYPAKGNVIAKERKISKKDPRYAEGRRHEVYFETTKDVMKGEELLGDYKVGKPSPITRALKESVN
jgi:SET domain-containing protein